MKTEAEKTKYRILALTNLLFKISIMFIVLAGMVLISGYLSKANGSDQGGLVVKEGNKIKIHYTVSLKDGHYISEIKKWETFRVYCWKRSNAGRA